jgi:hypothetical protein
MRGEVRAASSVLAGSLHLAGPRRTMRPSLHMSPFARRPVATVARRFLFAQASQTGGRVHGRQHNARR